MLNRFNQRCFRLKLSFTELENKAYCPFRPVFPEEEVFGSSPHLSGTV